MVNNNLGMNENKPTTIAEDVTNVLRGFCMGAADTVPGVSGGTVALILGHYTRLVTAISHVDGQLFGLIRERKFSTAAARLDLRFLVALAVGILAGIAMLAGVMHYLLDHHLPQTLAVFFGFLIASVWIVKDNVSKWNVKTWMALLVGVVVAVAITMVPHGDGELSLGYIFLAASVAICAMILPGISGAFILLLFGVYHEITGIIKDTVKMNFDIDSLLQLSVFAAGCLFGLLAFSKLLRYLLEQHRDVTMAGLVGLMLGSVAKLYPLQIPTAETAEMESKYRVMQLISPTRWPNPVWPLVAIIVAAAAFILIVERRFGSDAD